MMGVVVSLKRCWDLTDAHIAEALETRATMAQLLRDLAQVARPNDGGPKILIALARMATPRCDWLEGSVRLELERVEEDRTQITVMEDLGGVREIVFPRLVVNVPFAELERSVRVAPRAIEPLRVQKVAEGALVLAHRRTRSSRAIPKVELADDCVRRSQPPPMISAPGARAPRAGKPPPVPPAAARAAPPPLPSGARPPPAKGTRDGKEPKEQEDALLEIPRQPKVLDFGDFDRAQTRPSSPGPAPPKQGKPD